MKIKLISRFVRVMVIVIQKEFMSELVDHVSFRFVLCGNLDMNADIYV